MLYGDLQFFDIIIFAAIAGFIIYRLRSVLGKRTGFQKQKTDHRSKYKEEEANEVKEIPSLLDNQLKLQNVYEKVNDFDHKQFLEGAKKAFEIIITSFNNGDNGTRRVLIYNLMTYDVKKVCEIENVNHHIVKFKHLVNPYLYRFFKFVI